MNVFVPHITTQAANLIMNTEVLKLMHDFSNSVLNTKLYYFGNFSFAILYEILFISHLYAINTIFINDMLQIPDKMCIILDLFLFYETL